MVSDDLCTDIEVRGIKIWMPISNTSSQNNEMFKSNSHLLYQLTLERLEAADWSVNTNFQFPPRSPATVWTWIHLCWYTIYLIEIAGGIQGYNLVPLKGKQTKGLQQGYQATMNPVRRSFLKTQETKIQENCKNLGGMQSQSAELMNQLGAATLTIKKLKAELARVDHYIIYSRDNGAKLRLQAERLEYDKVGLTEKYEKILNKIDLQIQQKEQEIVEVKLGKKRIVSLRGEAMQKNEELKEDLKKVDKRVRLLKGQIANDSSWSVRNTPNRSSPSDG